MKFQPTNIKGCVVIEPEPHSDDRGLFRRHYDIQEHKAAGLNSDIRQCNVSENPHPYTLRGFHYQGPPHAEAKTLACFRGALYDIVVDLRADSPTFLKWQSFELTDENRLSVHVPEGCANAFLTLKPNTLIFYYVSSDYTPEAEHGFRYNDPLFNFSWPHQPEVISDKDKTWPDFAPPKP